MLSQDLKPDIYSNHPFIMLINISTRELLNLSQGATINVYNGSLCGITVLIYE